MHTHAHARTHMCAHTYTRTLAHARTYLFTSYYQCGSSSCLDESPRPQCPPCLTGDSVSQCVANLATPGVTYCPWCIRSISISSVGITFLARVGARARACKKLRVKLRPGQVGGHSLGGHSVGGQVGGHSVGEGVDRRRGSSFAVRAFLTA